VVVVRSGCFIVDGCGIEVHIIAVPPICRVTTRLACGISPDWLGRNCKKSQPGQDHHIQQHPHDQGVGPRRGSPKRLHLFWLNPEEEVKQANLQIKRTSFKAYLHPYHTQHSKMSSKLEVVRKQLRAAQQREVDAQRR
jgi:hypothetical protein